jgi:hypothetical protein
MLMKTGKIIIENNNFLTLQKEDRTFSQTVKRRFNNKTNLQYKVVSPTRIYPRFNTERAISKLL